VVSLHLSTIFGNKTVQTCGGNGGADDPHCMLWSDRP